MPLVHIHSENAPRVTLPAQAGANLLDVLRGHEGARLHAPCGGAGTCLKCRIRIISGGEGLGAAGADPRAFSTRELAAGWRLACRINLAEGMELVIAQPGHRAAESCEVGLGGRAARLEHSLRCVRLRVPPPSLADQRPDAARLLAALADSGQPAESTGTGAEQLSLSLPVLRDLPGLLRAHGGELAVVLDGLEIIAVRPPEETALLGAAVDLGTTTVAVALYDLRDGRLLHLCGAGNRQAEYGDDVISRINHAAQPGGLPHLAQAARASVSELLRMACAATGERVRNICALSIAGNTVMQHLLAGVDPQAIGASPFIPCFAHGLRLHAGEILAEPAGSRSDGEHISELARVGLTPCLSAYVGGDITAGILAQEFETRAGNWLLIDAGTNGEIVLRAGGSLLACSTAAGPAFEGARISCGMRACGGAISGVRLSHTPSGTDIVLETVNDEAAAGLCGSGLLDAVACLLDAGILDETGAFVDHDDLPDDFSPALRARLSGDGFSLAPEVTLTRRDVREFQLACAAIAAGSRVLMQEAGITARDLSGVLLAGGFGSRLRVESARRTGLVPPEVSAEKITPAGNTSLAGAALCLLSEEAFAQAQEIAGRVRCLELSGRADFQEYYLDALEFPAAP